MMPRPGARAVRVRRTSATWRYWLAAVLALIELHRRTRAGRSWALIRRGEAGGRGGRRERAAATRPGPSGWRAFAPAWRCALARGRRGPARRSCLRRERVGDAVRADRGRAARYHRVGALIAGLLLRAVPAPLIGPRRQRLSCDDLLRRGVAACAHHRTAAASRGQLAGVRRVCASGSCGGKEAAA